jgi:CBS domain-containing protein
MKVSEVMSTEFETIEKDQSLHNALNLMRKKKDISRLIVTQDEKPVGIISFRDVADRLGTYKTEGISPKSLHVSSAMTYPILTIDPVESVEEAAKIMVENRISSLLVMKDDKLLGILTKSDLLKVYTSCKSIKVKELMTEDPVKITESERVISARNTMMENNFSVLPVMDDAEIVGIIDDETLADALARFREQIPIKHQKARIHEFFIGQVMKSDPPIINQDAPLCDLISVFQDTKYKGVFVTDKTDKLVGIITLTDVTKAIVEGRK